MHLTCATSQGQKSAHGEFSLSPRGEQDCGGLGMRDVGANLPGLRDTSRAGLWEWWETSHLSMHSRPEPVCDVMAGKLAVFQRNQAFDAFCMGLVRVTHCKSGMTRRMSSLRRVYLDVRLGGWLGTVVLMRQRQLDVERIRTYPDTLAKQNTWPRPSSNVCLPRYWQHCHVNPGVNAFEELCLRAAVLTF